MHKIQVTILGGGSPYTLQFFKQLSATPVFFSCSFMLQGRDINKLNKIKIFLSHRFKNLEFEATTNLKEALLNANIVIHQIRYGGMQWRKTCEDICWKQKVLFDETLGLAPLLTLARYKTEITAVMEAIGKYASKALIINLTNPLSLICSLMNNASITAYGICELPILTLRKLANQFGVAETQVQWSYYGFNHRGFLYDIKHNAGDVLDKVAECGKSLVNDTLIRELDGYPLKYYFVYKKSLPEAPGRADELFLLKDELFDELDCINDFPAALAKRDMGWYDDATIPFINAWSGEGEWVGTLNIADEKTGLTWETKVKIAFNQIEITDDEVPCNKGFLKEIDTYHTHEKAALNFISNTSISTMLDTLECDPTFPYNPRNIPELKRIFNQIKTVA
jgi:6-phospho-beta-glucosidase